MAFLYITEYNQLIVTGTGRGGVPVEPAIAYQKIANDGASVASAVLNPKTVFVRLHTDSICSFKVDAAPTAVVTQNRMPANGTEYFGIDPVVHKATPLKIAAVLNT